MYEPSQQIVDRYAQVLVNFALHGGEGVKPGEVVYCMVPLEAMTMYGALQETILKAGAHPIMVLVPYQFDRAFYEHASEEQVLFFAQHYYTGLVQQIDHRIAILPRDNGPHSLEGIPPHLLELRKQAQAPLRAMLNRKEMEGKLSWTLALWGTEAYAQEAGMSLEEYWEQIIKACYLDQEDPVAAWKAAFQENNRVRQVLDSMHIKYVHVRAPETDLRIKIGDRRRWVGGSGRNIPSFEIFLSPDWRETEGCIAFSQPLYYNGTRIEGIKLEFQHGVVVRADATTNLHVLQAMIEKANADKLGEFSLTDGRFSMITRPMANTLYDENMGGPEGNMHIALGMSYPDTFDGDPTQLSPQEWEALGFNDLNCSVHTDIISTSPRTVTAELENGEKVVIYANGRFVI